MKLSKKVIVGTVVGSLLLTAGTAFAWTAQTKNIQARFAQIKLIVNGIDTQTKAQPFIYNGNVYAPVATVANMLDIDQQWDNKTPAVRFTSKGMAGWSGEGVHMVFQDTTPVKWLTDSIYFGKSNRPLEVQYTDPKGHAYYQPSTYEIVDMTDFKRLKRFAVSTDAEWVDEGEISLASEKFVNMTGKSNNEFLVYQLAPSGEKGKYNGYVNLHRYENGNLEHIAGFSLFESSTQKANVKYLPSSKEFQIDFLRADGKTIDRRINSKIQSETTGTYTRYFVDTIRE